MRIGLDVSIRYSSMCVSHDFKTFEFSSVVNDPRITGPSLSFLSDARYNYGGIGYKVLSAPRPLKDSAYHVKEREKTVMFDAVATSLADEALKCVGSETDVIVAMEGISYGSKGAAFVDTVLLTGFVRSKVLTTLLGMNSTRFFVFSPSELKNAIGAKGNADKWVICEAFVADPVIQEVRECGMHRMMTEKRAEENPKVYNMTAREIHSPFNDMVDAYLSVLKVYNVLSGKK